MGTLPLEPVVLQRLGVLFVCSILSFCHEKATVALYFGRIRARLGVVRFSGCFFDFFTTEFAACVKPLSRDNHRKARYPRT